MGDGNGESDVATVVITVAPVNDAPVAADDGANATAGVPLVIDVLANDADVDGHELVVTAVTQPRFGSVVNNGADVTYTGDVFAGFGAQVAALGLNPGQANSLIAKLGAAERSFARGNRTAGLNQLGAFVDELETLVRGGHVDPDLAALITAIVQDLQDGSVTDSFHYTIGDPEGLTDTATVTVTVMFF